MAYSAIAFILPYILLSIPAVRSAEPPIARQVVIRQGELLAMDASCQKYSIPVSVSTCMVPEDIYGLEFPRWPDCPSPLSDTLSLWVYTNNACTWTTQTYYAFDTWEWSCRKTSSGFNVTYSYMFACNGGRSLGKSNVVTSILTVRAGSARTVQSSGTLQTSASSSPTASYSQTPKSSTSINTFQFSTSTKNIVTTTTSISQPPTQAPNLETTTKSIPSTPNDQVTSLKSSASTASGAAVPSATSLKDQERNAAASSAGKEGGGMSQEVKVGLGVGVGVGVSAIIVAILAWCFPCRPR